MEQKENNATITPEIQERLDLIMSVADFGGEIVGADQLPALLASGEELITYDGFEPSGQMHIAQGVLRAINTNKMIRAGFKFKMYVADWYGYLNNKMGGDIEKIQKVGQYFIEIWRSAGMDLAGVEFIWASDAVKDPVYWENVMKISKNATLRRVLKTTEIMGRSESDDLTAAQIIYPCMQTTDIFHVMKCQVTQLGLDQRKVNMLAREIGESIGYWKPVVVSNSMLTGLQKPAGERVSFTKTYKVGDANQFGSIYLVQVQLLRNEKDEVEFIVSDVNGSRTNHIILSDVDDSANLSGATLTLTNVNNEEVEARIEFYDIDPNERTISMKMSKSKPDTAIFMTDTRADIERKIRKAYCPEGVVAENPVLDYCKQIIFQSHFLVGQEHLLHKGFEIKRPEQFGGDVVYQTYQELEQDYADKKLFPLDLKNAVVDYLDLLLQPTRDHFMQNEDAKALLAEVQSFEVTR